MPWSAILTLVVLICIFVLGVRLMSIVFQGQALRLALIVWYVIGIVVLLSWLGVIPGPAWWRWRLRAP